MNLDRLNRLDAADFVATLGSIFEHSPWVAEAVVSQRPFPSVEALHAAMCRAVATADPGQQRALIRAHPQLASKAAIRGELSEASNREQAGAGLLNCSTEEFARLNALNAAYQQRFGFPFIIAVRDHDRAGILDQLARRLDNRGQEEHIEALRQIERIAAFRLGDLFGTPGG